MGGEREIGPGQTLHYDVVQSSYEPALVYSEPEPVGTKEVSSVGFWMQPVRSALQAARERPTSQHCELLRRALIRAGQAVERAARVVDQMAANEVALLQVQKAEYDMARQWLDAAAPEQHALASTEQTSVDPNSTPSSAEPAVTTSTPPIATTTVRAAWSDPVPQQITPMDWLMTRVERASDGSDDPKAAQAVVLAIEVLPAKERAELSQRMLHYRPGNGDELAGRMHRLPLATRRLINTALSGVDLGLWRTMLSPAPNRGLGREAVTPRQYIAHWEPRLVHELAKAAAADGWPTPHAQVQWLVEPAQVATNLEVTLTKLAESAGGFSSILPTLTCPLDAMALIADYMDPRETLGTDPAWQAHLVQRLGLAMHDAMSRALPRMAQRLAARAAVTKGATIASTDLVLTEPVDRVAANLLCRPGVTEVTYVDGKSASSAPDDFAYGLRPLAAVEFLGERDRALWNWIDVKHPSDATREEVAQYLLGTTTDAHTDQAFAISYVGTRFALPISLARGVPALMKYAPDDVRSCEPPKTIEAQSRNDLVALAGSATAVELTAQPQTANRDVASVGQLTRSRIETYRATLQPLGVDDFAAPATQWLNEVLAKPGPEVASWAKALERQSKTIAEAGTLLRQAAPVLGAAQGAGPAQEVARDLAAAIGTAHLPGIGADLLRRVRTGLEGLPMQLLHAGARDLLQARLALSGGITRSPAEATQEQQEQQDVDDRMIALERQARGGALNPDALAEQALMQRMYALRFRSQALRDQTQALSKALDSSNDGAISWLSNLGHNGDIDSAYARFTGVSKRAQQIVATMEETIAQGPHALVCYPDDGPATRELRASAVDTAEAAFKDLAGEDNFGNDLKEAWKLAEDSQRRSAIGHIVAQIALLIGIGLVSGGIAAWVGGVARGAMLARTAMTAATVARGVRAARIVGTATQIGVDATIQATAQTAITGDSFGQSFAENLVSSAAILAALKPVHKLSQRVRDGLNGAEAAAAQAAEGAAELSAARKLWRYTKSGRLVLDGSVMSLELLTQAGVGAVVTRAVRGKPKNEEEATSWFVTGASMVIARVLAGRMRGLEQRLQEHGQVSGYLLKRVRQRAQFAEAHAEALDPDVAWNLVEDYRAFLLEEAAILASPDAELGLAPERLAELQQANAQGFDAADQRAIATVAILDKRLRPISSDGVEWVGSQANVDAAIAAAHATVVVRDRTHVEVDIAGERRTLFVIEAADGPHVHGRLDNPQSMRTEALQVQSVAQAKNNTLPEPTHAGRDNAETLGSSAHKGNSEGPQLTENVAARRRVMERYKELRATDFSGVDDPRLHEIAEVARLENGEVATRIRGALEKAGVQDVEIQFRAKSLHSILGKLQETPGMQIKDIKDLSGVRINIARMREANFAQYEKIKIVIQQEFGIPDAAVKDYNQKPNPWGYTGRIHLFELGEADVFSEIQVGSKDLSNFIEKRFPLRNGKVIELHDLTGYKGQLYGKELPQDLQAEYTRLIGRITMVNASGNDLASAPEVSAEVDAYFTRVQAVLDL